MSTEFKTYQNKPPCADACFPEPFTAKDGREFMKCTICNNLVFEQKKKAAPVDKVAQKLCLDHGHGELETKTCREGSANAGREYQTCKDCNAFVKFVDGKPSNKKGTKRSFDDSNTSTAVGINTDQILAAVLAVETQVKKLRTELHDREILKNTENV